jgi:hypothetical protein
MVFSSHTLHALSRPGQCRYHRYSLICFRLYSNVQYRTIPLCTHIELNSCLLPPVYRRSRDELNARYGEKRANPVYFCTKDKKSENVSASILSLFVELGSACSEFVFACLFGEVVGLDEALYFEKVSAGGIAYDWGVWIHVASSPALAVRLD